MNDAEIDAQWKLEKQKRNQDLLDYFRSSLKERTQPTDQAGKQPDIQVALERKHEIDPPVTPKRPMRRR